MGKNKVKFRYKETNFSVEAWSSTSRHGLVYPCFNFLSISFWFDIIYRLVEDQA